MENKKHLELSKFEQLISVMKWSQWVDRGAEPTAYANGSKP